MKKVDLSGEAVRKWRMAMQQLAFFLFLLGSEGGKIPPIPEEKGKIDEEGNLIVSVELPGLMYTEMKVPPGHWRISPEIN